MSSELPEVLTVDRRRAIFRAVVESQDGGQTIADSRASAAERFAVTEDQVRAIEQEGVDHEWPPL